MDWNSKKSLKVIITALNVGFGNIFTCAFSFFNVKGHPLTLSFPSDGYGLYEMAGNVWELAQDWYDVSYYKSLASNKENITR